MWISLEPIIKTLENIIISENYDNLTKSKTLGLKKILCTNLKLIEYLESRELNVCNATVLFNSIILIQSIRLESDKINNLIESFKK